jgi:DNA transformation protein and related proteins
MAVRPQFLAFVLEQLAGVNSLRANRMFGAIGLYSGDLFFGLIDDDTVYFKTDESNIAPYRERNMPRFMPFPDRPEVAMGYRQVPADIIEDTEEFVAWARRSAAVAGAARLAKSRPRAKKRTPPKRTPAKRTRR